MAVAADRRVLRMCMAHIVRVKVRSARGEGGGGAGTEDYD
jgi:hypothetical protein